MFKAKRKILSMFLALAMAAGLAACANDASTSVEQSTSTASTAVQSGEHPLAVEELGAGDVKWSEEKTADGWMQVANTGGQTLGYSPDSGVSLIQHDGFAFKDLNGNGLLDAYEDWRLDTETRAADLASQLDLNQISSLMVVNVAMGGNLSGTLDDDQKAILDEGVRGAGHGSIGYPTEDILVWVNAVQAYAESNNLGIPMQLYSDPRNSGWGIDVSPWPDNLALAASFDPDLATEAYQQLAKEYRALGLTTLLGPQTDLATEPRWGRTTGGFGEDPALARDMMNAATSALQSTYDANGTDLGWGADSVNAMMKHWPGDGAAQSGREAHDSTGAFNVYPGDAFESQLIPFVDGAMQLDGLTGSASAAMTSYSIAWSEDEKYGELVATSFSEYKVGLLRSYGFDGVICTDWEVLNDGGKVWGVEGLTSAERAYKAIKVGVDQFGGQSDLEPVRAGIQMLVDDIGEEAATAQLQETARRLLRNYFNVGIFENPYLDVAYGKATIANADATAAAFEAQVKTVVMLKNDDAISESTSSEKPTVYVPLVYTPGTIGFVGQPVSSADLPVDRAILEEYFVLVTDTVSDTWTGPEDDDGNPTLAYEDIIRASAAELAECDYSLVFARTPKNTSGWSITGGFDMMTQSYIPISLQYGEYTANGANVRKESIAGHMVEGTVQTPYGEQPVKEQENETYYGNTAQLDNATDLDMILYATNTMPADAKVIVAINAAGKSPVAAMVVNEFESQVDGILYGFNIDNRSFLDIATGRVEPSALLPVDLPKDMDAVEAQYEDVARDLECHVDTMGNTYSFAFGLNWSGVIQDERTQKYDVPALTEPATQKP